MVFRFKVKEIIGRRETAGCFYNSLGNPGVRRSSHFPDCCPAVTIRASTPGSDSSISKASSASITIHAVARASAVIAVGAMTVAERVDVVAG